MACTESADTYGQYFIEVGELSKSGLRSSTDFGSMSSIAGFGSISHQQPQYKRDRSSSFGSGTSSSSQPSQPKQNNSFVSSLQQKPFNKNSSNNSRVTFSNENRNNSSENSSGISSKQPQSSSTPQKPSQIGDLSKKMAEMKIKKVDNSQHVAKKDMSRVKCYVCGEQGHYAVNRETGERCNKPPTTEYKGYLAHCINNDYSIDELPYDSSYNSEYAKIYYAQLEEYDENSVDECLKIYQLQSFVTEESDESIDDNEGSDSDF